MHEVLIVIFHENTRSFHIVQLAVVVYVRLLHVTFPRDCWGVVGHLYCAKEAVDYMALLPGPMTDDPQHQVAKKVVHLVGLEWFAKTFVFLSNPVQVVKAFQTVAADELTHLKDLHMFGNSCRMESS